VPVAVCLETGATGGDGVKWLRELARWALELQPFRAAYHGGDVPQASAALLRHFEARVSCAFAGAMAARLLQAGAQLARPGEAHAGGPSR